MVLILANSGVATVVVAAVTPTLPVTDPPGMVIGRDSRTIRQVDQVRDQVERIGE